MCVPKRTRLWRSHGSLHSVSYISSCAQTIIVCTYTSLTWKDELLRLLAISCDRALASDWRAMSRCVKDKSHLHHTHTQDVVVTNVNIFAVQIGGGFVECEDAACNSERFGQCKSYGKTSQNFLASGTTASHL